VSDARASKPPASPDDGTGTVTAQLRAWSRGDAGAGEEVAARLYPDLRGRALGYLRHERAGHLLQPTALVNEAFVRLLDLKEIDWESRSHFFGVAAVVMRRILVDYARTRLSAKRGGSWCRVPLHDDTAASGTPSPLDVDLLDLHAALTDLAEQDQQQARIVEMRYFAGLSIEETAQALDVSAATVKREWDLARAWLCRRLKVRPA
jgi:RNA polymerase sigma-70 factor (ECF subfamily)